MRLNTVRLLVSDMASLAAFYERRLGLRRVWGSAELGYVSFDLGASRLSLFGADAQAAAMGDDDMRSGAGAPRSLLVIEVPDVDQAVTDLAARGVAFDTRPTDQPDWGIRVAYLRDPEGRPLELMTPLPEERWSEALRIEDRKHRPAS